MLGIMATIFIAVLSAFAGSALFFVAGTQAVRRRQHLKSAVFLSVAAILGLPSAAWLAAFAWAGLASAVKLGARSF